MSVCRIYHRHTRQHKLTGKGQFLSCAFSLFHFPIPRSLSFLLWLSRTVSWVKENHVILFICNYQSQTPCKQAGRRHVQQQRSIRACGDRHAAATQLTGIQCAQPLKAPTHRPDSNSQLPLSDYSIASRQTRSAEKLN